MTRQEQMAAHLTRALGVKKGTHFEKYSTNFLHHLYYTRSNNLYLC